MNSCLYKCEVMHYRLKPKKHKLVHKVFMFYVDLDELGEIEQRIPNIGYNKPKTYSFYDSDHLQLGKRTTKENLLEFLKDNHFHEPIKRVMLLTNLRTFGHIFNPVSFYYCFNDKNEPCAAVAEIGNTFREMKLYFFGPQTFSADKFQETKKKEYYISPFANLDIQMEFQLKVPSENLDVRVQDMADNDKFLYATLIGQKKELSKRNIFLYTLMFPLITLKVIGLIHWHAFLLWLKGVPYHNKEENTHLQKGVLHVFKNTSEPYIRPSERKA